MIKRTCAFLLFAVSCMAASAISHAADPPASPALDKIDASYLVADMPKLDPLAALPSADLAASPNRALDFSVIDAAAAMPAPDFAVSEVAARVRDSLSAPADASLNQHQHADRALLRVGWRSST